MSWQFVPGQCRIPKVPFWDPPSGVWRGVGYDAGFFAYRSGSKYVIVRSDGFIPQVVVDGVELRPVYSDVNGYMYWSGSRNLYYTQTYGWVLCSLSPGCEPLEEQRKDADTGQSSWAGDSFWVLSGFPAGPDRETTLTARGKERGGEQKTLRLVWERWERGSEFGEYEGVGGADGKMVVGLPQFRTGGGETFVRSLKRDSSGRFTYGRIRFANGKWVIGEVGSASGWHEGSEPTAGGGSVRFAFCRPRGSEVAGEDVMVSFDRYVCGDEKDTAYLGEAAVWR